MAEPWSAVPEWMAKAEGDWEALEILLSRDSPHLRDSVVFHAQQCVEKLLMAAGLANRRKTQPFQRANDLPSGKVRELRHGREC